MRVTKEITFEAAHRLRFHRGACRNLHGHSYRVRVTAAASTKLLEDRELARPTDPETGMVVDFGVLAEAMREVLITGVRRRGDATFHVSPWDHSLIVHKEDPFAEAILAASMKEELDIGSQRMIILDVEPTAENMAACIGKEINEKLGIGIGVVRVELWETATSCATWEPEA